MSRVQLSERYMGGTLNPKYILMALDNNGKNRAELERLVKFGDVDAEEVENALETYPDKAKVLEYYIEASKSNRAKKNQIDFSTINPTQLLRAKKNTRDLADNPTGQLSNQPYGFELLSDDALIALGIPKWAIGIKGIDEQYGSIAEYREYLLKNAKGYAEFYEEYKHIYPDPNVEAGGPRIARSFSNVANKIGNNINNIINIIANNGDINKNKKIYRDAKDGMAEAITHINRYMKAFVENTPSQSAQDNLQKLINLVTGIDADKFEGIDPTNNKGQTLASLIKELQDKIYDVVDFNNNRIDGTDTVQEPVAQADTSTQDLQFNDGSTVSVANDDTSTVASAVNYEDAAYDALDIFKARLKDRGYKNTISGKIRAGVKQGKGVDAWNDALATALENIIKELVGENPNDINAVYDAYDTNEEIANERDKICNVNFPAEKYGL